MEVLYKDSEIIVCIKPVGISTQGESGDMVSSLKAELNTEIFPVHRLDKGVGGVMVFALNKKSAASLSMQIQANSFKKEYLALVHGILEEKSGTLTDLLFKDSSKNKVFVVKKERKGVRRAVCRFEVLGEGKQNGIDASLVRVQLETGRTHQIRVQFASRKHPLFGDRRYGARDDEKNIFLFSKKIEFSHPKTGQNLSFEAKKPIFALNFSEND